MMHCRTLDLHEALVVMDKDEEAGLSRVKSLLPVVLALVAFLGIA
jgi:hypothetical protein